MYSTTQLGLPLVMPAQAQKHVTVNEAFVRLDAAVQMRFARSTLASPPSAVADGQCFLIPEGATGEWNGASGQIAARSNGGWIYLTPSAGWTGWDLETATRLFFDGSDWSPEPEAVSSGGAMTFTRIVEFDHEIIVGPHNLTSVVIPANSQVLALTGRVKDAIEGSGLASWQLGVDGFEDRYGSGLGLSRNSYVVGLTGFPVTYYAETALKLSAQGGTFERGSVRICAHLLSVRAPGAF